MVITPEGKIARYFYGIEYKPRDLRLGLVEASANKIGTPVDQVLLFCYHYDPITGKYGFAIINVTRVLGSATVLAAGSVSVHYHPAGSALPCPIAREVSLSNADSTLAGSRLRRRRRRRLPLLSI